jgi:O-acetyl-ADP-ribose deacetylase (regulator of RNase III)
MPFHVIRQDITKIDVDAIVNPTQNEPVIGGSTDLEINQVARKELFLDRQQHGYLETTEAIRTKGYQLKASFVIHTVGPVYKEGFHNEKELLLQTYQNCLNLALKHQFESIAFPLISSGHFGYPKDQALDHAIEAIKSFLDTHEMTIYLVVYDEISYKYSKERFKDVQNYISNHLGHDLSYEGMSYFNPIVSYDRRIDEVLDQIDETFTQKLFRFIREKKLDEVKVYKKANMTKQHFSKIRSDDNYQPKKETAIALAIGLELNIDETKDLLKSCGYALSQSSYFDLIIEYFIKHKSYDLYEINLVLLKFDQKQIGVI